MFCRNSQHDHLSHSKPRRFDGRSHGLESRGALPHFGRHGGLENGHLYGSPLNYDDTYSYGRPGERFGWGREGRVRLDEPPILSNRRGSVAGTMGRMGGLDGPRFGGGGGGAGWGRNPLDELSMYDLPRGPRYPRGGLDPLGGRFLDSRYETYLDTDTHMNNRSGFPDRFSRGDPYMSGALPTGLGLGASMSSPGSGSRYSLDHLDRPPRSYHYQPPYVEDDIDDFLIEEELFLLKRHEEELIRRSMASGQVYDEYEDALFDPRRRRGAL